MLLRSSTPALALSLARSLPSTQPRLLPHCPGRPSSTPSTPLSLLSPAHSDSPFLQIRHTRINKLMITLDLRQKVLLLPRRIFVRLGHGREVLSLQFAEMVLLPYIRGDGDE